MKYSKVISVIPTLGVFAMVLFPGAGCATQNPEQRRAEEAEAWSSRMQRETRVLLDANGGKISLARAVHIARDRNGELMMSRMEETLAKLDHQTTFSAFLPRIQLQYQAQSLSEPAQRRMGAQVVTTTDSSGRDGSLAVMQPLFTPNAWMMVGTASHATRARSLVRERAVQLLDAQVARVFLEACAAESRYTAARREVEYTAKILRDVSAMEQKGIAVASDRLRAEAMNLTAESEKNAAGRICRETKSRLMQTLNLWPLVEFEVIPPDTEALAVLSPHAEGFSGRLTKTEVAKRSTEEWLAMALFNRPDLYAADQNVALRKNEILRALTLFLPELYVYANGYTTSDSYVVNTKYWATGLRATLSAFFGFQHVQAYRRAGREAKMAEISREMAAMSVCLEIVEAHRQLQDFDEMNHAAMAQAAAATQRAAERKAAYESGQAPVSEWMAARAEESHAVAACQQATYRNLMALFVFASAAGMSVEEEGNHAK